MSICQSFPKLWQSVSSGFKNNNLIPGEKNLVPHLKLQTSDGKFQIKKI